VAAVAAAARPLIATRFTFKLLFYFIDDVLLLLPLPHRPLLVWRLIAPMHGAVAVAVAFAVAAVVCVLLVSGLVGDGQTDRQTDLSTIQVQPFFFFPFFSASEEGLSPSVAASSDGYGDGDDDDEEDEGRLAPAAAANAV
jgi:hypothetical protein